MKRATFVLMIFSISVMSIASTVFCADDDPCNVPLTPRREVEAERSGEKPIDEHLLWSIRAETALKLREELEAKLRELSLGEAYFEKQVFYADLDAIILSFKRGESIKDKLSELLTSELVVLRTCTNFVLGVAHWVGKEKPVEAMIRAKICHEIAQIYDYPWLMPVRTLLFICGES